MDVIHNLIGTVSLPRMAPVRQIFEDNSLADVEATLRQNFANTDIGIEPGQSIAVGVGSRGLAQLPLLVRVTVEEIKKRGGEPFIVPAMGSHGGATAEGQQALLAKLGVSEETVGAPVRATMETVEIGVLDSGLPVYLDKLAAAADGIAIVNRVKPHTSFSGPYESGLVKMITIGLGKHKGAESCHAMGFGKMADNIVAMSTLMLSKKPILFGVASVENAYDRIAKAEVVPGQAIMEREPELLAFAKANMPRILFNPVDVLVVDIMGKEFSGTGADPNVTGRAATPYIETTMQASKFIILDLSLKSGGNATGMGLADIVTRRLVDKIDFAATYANTITSTVTPSAKIPVIMETDDLAIRCAVKTCNGPEPARLRMVRIANTLSLEHILVSEALLPEAEARDDVEVLGPAEDMRFDDAGALLT